MQSIEHDLSADDERNLIEAARVAGFDADYDFARGGGQRSTGCGSGAASTNATSSSR